MAKKATAEVSNEMKPFTGNDDLPEPKMKKGRKEGEMVFAGYAEPRYFIRSTPTSYEVIKVFKKPHGVLRRHAYTLKRRNKKHMIEFRRLRDTVNLPIQGD